MSRPKIIYGLLKNLSDEMVKRLKEKIVIYKYNDSGSDDSSDDSDYVPPEDTESDSSESVDSNCSGDVLPTDSEDSVYKSEAPSQTDTYESSFIDDRSYSTYSYTSNPQGDVEMKHYY